MDIMRESNYDRKFIEWFDEIKIQPTYSMPKEQQKSNDSEEQQSSKESDTN